MGRKQLGVRAEFRRRVRKTSTCHWWLGAKDTSGDITYGRFNFRGWRVRAHRAAWEFAHGEPPPSDMFVCHTCDNGLCVNPKHLFLGTHQDNMDDMVSKGRAKGNKGEANGFSKLTEKEVVEMRELYRTQEWRMPDLAKRYSISLCLTHMVIRGKRWAHVPGAVPSTIKHKDAH